MKPSIVLLSFSLLFFSITINSCKEVEPDTPPVVDNQPEGCTMTSQVENGVKTTYEYNDKYQVIKAYGSGDTSYFEYDASGKLTKASDSEVEALMDYSSNVHPDKIAVYENNVLSTIFNIEFSGGNIVKIQTFDASNQSKALQILDFTYNGAGKLTDMVLQVYDDFSDEYYNFIDATNIVTDGKINPYFKSTAILFRNIENPFAFGKDNIIEADLKVLEQETEFSTSYNYNTDNYPTIADISIPGGSRYTEFEYNCK